MKFKQGDKVRIIIKGEPYYGKNGTLEREMLGGWMVNFDEPITECDKNGKPISRTLGCTFKEVDIALQTPAYSYIAKYWYETDENKI